jgi:hypothetical protein
MWELIVNELTQTTLEIVRGMARMVPNLVLMIVIALAGWVIAYLLKIVLRGILRLLKFDKLSENAGASRLLSKAALPGTTELLSRFVFWVVWLGFILMGISKLGIGEMDEHIYRFFDLLPRVFVALFIVFFGLVAASFFSRAALLAAVNADLPSARIISLLVRVLIISFAVSMGFEELGIGQETVLLAFGLVFGALMLGMALAFGLGGKDLAREYLERRFTHSRREPEREDELSPL